MILISSLKPGVPKYECKVNYLHLCKYSVKLIVFWAYRDNEPNQTTSSNDSLLSRIDVRELKSIKVAVRRLNIPELPNSTPPPIQRSLDDPADLIVHRRGKVSFLYLFIIFFYLFKIICIYHIMEWCLVNFMIVYLAWTLECAYLRRYTFQNMFVF